MFQARSWTRGGKSFKEAIVTVMHSYIIAIMGGGAIFNVG